MKYLKFLILAIVMFSCGIFTAKYYLPETKVEKVEVIKVQKQERVVTKILERPDGTKETVITKESLENKWGNTTVNKVTSASNYPNWSLGIMAGGQLNNLLNPTYTLTIDRRVFMGINVGIYARTDSELGLSLRVNF